LLKIMLKKVYSNHLLETILLKFTKNLENKIILHLNKLH